MKMKRGLSILLVLVMLFGLLPMAAFAATVTNDYAANINVTKETDDTFLVEYQVKTVSSKTIKGVQTVALAYDAALFDLLDNSNKNVQAELTGELSENGAYSKRPLGFDVNTNKGWLSGTTTFAVRNNTGFALLQPECKGTTLDTNGLFSSIASIHLALKSGKNVSDVVSNSIRLISLDEANNLNQNSLAIVNDGTTAYMYGEIAHDVFTNNDTLAAPTFTFTGFTPAIPAYSGTQASAPTVASKKGGAVTLTANATIEGETVEYAYATTTTAPTAGWQTNVAFTELAAGSYYFFARVAAKGIEHQAGTAAVSAAVEVFAAPTISYETNTLGSLVIDTAITSMTPTVSGGNKSYTYQMTGTLPTGLTLVPTTGVISGTPTTYAETGGSVTITVTDGEAVVSAPVTVTFSAVAKKPGELVIAAIDDVTYGNNPTHKAATTNTSSGTVTYTYSKTEKGTFEVWKTSNPVGTYWAKGTVQATTTIAEEVSNPVSFKVVPAAIIGTVTITGDTKYGAQLTANPTSIPGTNAYKWYRGETEISGATAINYTLVTADVGKTISVKVSDSAGNYSGTIEATTEAIAKADAPTTVTGAVSLYHEAKVASSLGFSSLTRLPTDIDGAKFSAASLGTNTKNILTSVAVNTTDATKLDYTPTGTAGAEKTATVTATVTSSNYENISVTITFSTVNISIPWPTGNGIIVKATPVYGDTYADILTGFTEAATATAAEVNITGKFSVRDAAVYPDAGVTTATLVFTPDANQSISGTFENAYTITAVAPKPITATVTAATRIYSEANPSFVATVPDGALVGEDTIDGLGLGLTSTASSTSDVGAYAVTGDGEYNTNYTVTVDGEKTLTVTPKTLTVAAGDYAVTKEYDGTTTAGKASGALALTDIVNSDDVSVKVGTIGAYADKNAANNKTITLSGLTLDGKKKGNYTLGDVSTFNMSTAEITKKDITAVTAGTYSVTKVYNGTTTAGTASGKLGLTGMVSGDDLDINATIGEYADANVGDAKAVTLTLGALTGADAGNYNKNLGSSQTTLDLKNAIITPADYSYTVGAQQVRQGGGLDKLSHPATGTGIGTTPEAVNGTFKWFADASHSSEATDAAISALDVGAKNTLYWTFTAANTGVGANYVQTPKSGEITVTITDGYPQTLKFANSTVSKTYGEGAFTITATQETKKPSDCSDDEFKSLPQSTTFTYTSTKPNVATVNANTGAVTIVSAGKTTISATAAAVPGTWAKSSTSYELTVSARVATLTWAGDGSLTYDNQAKNVTATVGNKIGEDKVTVTVTGGKEVNAGTHTATASALEGKAAGNYKLPSANTHNYTIAKADRAFTVTAATLKLAGDKLTGEVGKTTFDDLDKSAVVKYVSTDTAVATVNNGGRVTAVGNGTADINATIAETDNYNAQVAVKVADVTAVTTPITGLTSVASSTNTDKLSASISGNTIKLAGFVRKDATITVTPAYATNATLKSESVTTLVATDEEALKAGGSFIVTAFTTIDVNYIIDTSAVVLKATNVEMGETDDVTDAKEIEEAKKSEVEAALNNAATKAEDLLAAAAKALLEGAGKKNEALTEKQKADLGTGYSIKAEVYLEISATAYTSSSSLALEITPWVKYSGVAGTSGTGGTGTGIPDLGSAKLENSAIKAPVKISLALPANFPNDKLFAKHTKLDGTVEILTVTVNKGVATWYQSSFSKTELFADTRAGNISYTFEDGTQQSISYSAKDIGTALPTDTKSGNTFNGWTIQDVTGVQKTMTDALLNAINGGKTATPSFTPAFSGGGDTTSNLTINASAGEGGTITPNGKLAVEKNGSMSFAIKPNEGYSIDTILVDGKAIGKVSSYTFKNVTENHSIAVTFKKGDDFAKFIDVKGHWAESAMRFVFENEIMSGMSQITFEPETELSRAMLVTMLYRIDGKPAVSSKPSFKDVASGMWYTDAIAWAEANKIISGMGDGNFAPNASIQRQQMAAILYRYMQFKGRDVSGSSELTAFTDAKMIGDWALPAMKWAVQEKLISGRTASTLEPLGTAKRAEVAMVMMRWLQK